MSERSYAQVRWQQDRCGLMLVNAKREKFFLYADKLRELYDHQDEYLVLKLRDKRPNRAIGYYPGPVYGTMEVDEGTVEIWLYILEPYKKIEINAETGEPSEYLVLQKFAFPIEEFMRFKLVLDTMLTQSPVFNEQLQIAEMTPLTLP